MKKLYVIPGWRETCRRRQYQKLAKAARARGFDVVFRNVDWDQKLSGQTFKVEEDAVLFGFSLGAILARLIAQEHRCRLVILASMTPLRHFRGGAQEQILVDAVGRKLVADVKEHLKPRTKSRKLLMYGDKEGERADVTVRNTDHEITGSYIKEILRLV